MNKFEDLIKDAHKAYEPDPEFVDKTMKRIHDQKPRRRFGFKLWAPVIAGSAAVFALVFLYVPKPAAPDVASTSGSTVESQPQPPVQTVVSPVPLEGADNESLENDLSSIQNAIKQADNDQSDVESTLASS